MRRVGFPCNLSIGIDTVFLPRIGRLVGKRDGRNLIPFARRILHPLELRDLSHRHPQWQSQPQGPYTGCQSLTNWLGGRFAAKEAARKAIGATTLGWKDVRVEVEGPSGKPRIIYTILDVDNQNIEHEARLSISHDGDYVVATVLAATFPRTNANHFNTASAGP